MGEFLNNLTIGLNQICSTFTHVPPQTPYPYISLDVEQKLQGLPWGPSMVILNVKIWSRYSGTQEILKLAKGVEGFLYGSPYCHAELVSASKEIPKDPRLRGDRARDGNRDVGSAFTTFRLKNGISLKILESTLVLLNDGQTRIHSFRLKARISGSS